MDYVELGVDMMDCVLPTRSARHGCLFTSQGRILIKNARYAKDVRGRLTRPANARFAAAIRARTCGIFILANELLAAILNSHHNIHFYLDMMRKIREAIGFGNLARFRTDLQARLEIRHTEMGV